MIVFHDDCFVCELRMIDLLTSDPGGKAPGSGPICDVSLLHQIGRVDPDADELVHLPESVLGRD